MRAVLADSLSSGDGPALVRLASDFETVVRRPAVTDLEAPRRVLLAGAPARGPWLGYLLSPDGSGCWLALGWSPSREAEAVRGTFPLEADEHFRAGPIDAAPGTVLFVEYAAAALPLEHRLLNDLHAMVMLHDLLAERAPGGRR